MWGIMLTVQTSMGFLLTLVTIHLIPVVVDLIGWAVCLRDPGARSGDRHSGHVAVTAEPGRGPACWRARIKASRIESFAP